MSTKGIEDGATGCSQTSTTAIGVGGCAFVAALAAAGAGIMLKKLEKTYGSTRRRTAFDSIPRPESSDEDDDEDDSEESDVTSTATGGFKWNLGTSSVENKDASEVEDS